MNQQAIEQREAPHSLDAERAVLGAILVSPDGFDDAAAVLRPEMFFRAAHRWLFEAMLAVQAHGSALQIDYVTVRAELERQGKLDDVGGPAYIAALVDGMPRQANVRAYAGIVQEKALRRLMIAASTHAIAEAYESEAEAAQILDQALATYIDLGTLATGPGFVRIGEKLADTMTRLEDLGTPGSAAWGEQTGLSSLDCLLRGLRRQCVIVLAGRPGSGKSALACNIAVHLTRRPEDKRVVALFSLEMGTEELMNRLVCTEARLDISHIMTGKLDGEDGRRLTEAYTALSDAPLFIDDNAHSTLFEIRAKSRRLRREAGRLDLVIVDYIQLIEGKARNKTVNRNEEVAQLSRGLKRMAKDLDVPVLALSALNRAPEARTDHRPTLADLRESGAIEQDADVVILIYHPDEHPKPRRRAPKSKELIEEEIQKGVTELIVAKHRGGPTGVARVMWRKEYTRFEPLAI